MNRLEKCPHCRKKIDIVLSVPKELTVEEMKEILTPTPLERICVQCKTVHPKACFEDAPETCCLYYLKYTNPDATPKDIFDYCCILHCGFFMHDCKKCLVTDIGLIKFIKIEKIKELPAPALQNGQTTLTGVDVRPNEYPIINTGPRGSYARRRPAVPRKQHNVGNTDLAYAVTKKALQEHGIAFSMDVSEMLPGDIEAAASVVSRVFNYMIKEYGEQIRKTRMKRPGHRACNVLILWDDVKVEDIIWKDWAVLSSRTSAEDSPASSK